MKHLKQSSLLTITLFLFSFGLKSQDYSKQIEAFTKSFANKDIEVLKPHLSDKLQFGKIPVENTPAIMGNIVKNLPQLNSMLIVESEEGKAKVAYDFVGFGKSESFIYFDKDGKMTRILLVEDLINQEAEARRQQKVPVPTPGKLGEKYTSKEVDFKAKDGLAIYADLYEIDKNRPTILLLHQAGYNRAEYADIAPKLNEMGYTCLAIDLRSGGVFAGQPNETNQAAVEKGLNPEMVDARQDIEAAIDYLYKKYQKKVVLWGSSFSSSLALIEAANNEQVKAIIGFSPGDYFGGTAPSLSAVFAEIEKPFLVTSSQSEAENLTNLMGNHSLKKNQSQFIPESDGFHGSRALWEGQEGAEEYWKAVTQFLKEVKE